jgi:hypothetical protein
MEELHQPARRLKLTIVVGIVLLVAAGIVAFRRLDQPTEEEKTVSYWASELGQPEPAAVKARLVLKKVGPTDTVQFLAKKLGRKEPGWHTFYRTHYSQLPGFIRHRLQPPRYAAYAERVATERARIKIAEYIAWLAREFPDETKGTVPKLVSLLPDSNVSVRFAAGLALSGFGTNAAPAVPVIGRLLDTEPQKVTDEMLLVLENCGPAALATIPALRSSLASPNAHQRICCARTLWLLDKSQADTVRRLAKTLLAESDADVRTEAARLLSRIDGDSR